MRKRGELPAYFSGEARRSCRARALMPLGRISTSTGRTARHDEIVAVLGSQILSGARPPGSRLPTEEEMLATFGASRVLLREVTKTLVAKGLAVAKTRVGTRVLPPERWNCCDPDLLAWRLRLGLDPEFIEQLAQMRRAVEPAAAALAAEQRNEAHLEEMRGALAAMSRAGSDRRAFSAADLDFHIAVAVASGNPLFRSIAGVIETALGAYFTLSTPMEVTAMTASVERHALIADAIERRDAMEAARAMLAVINDGPSAVAGGQSATEDSGPAQAIEDATATDAR